MSDSRFRRLRWWLIGVGLALAVLALGYWSWRLAARHAVEWEMRLLAGDGYPVSPEELRRRYPDAPEETREAFEEWLREWLALEVPDFFHMNWDWDEVTPEALEAWRPWLEAWSERRPALAEFAGHERWPWPADWEAAHESRMLFGKPHLELAGWLNRVVSRRFRLMAARGDAAGAMAEWRDLARLDALNGGEVSGIGFFVRSIGRLDRLDALGCVAASGELAAFSDADLAELTTAFDDEAALGRQWTVCLAAEMAGLRMLLDEMPVEQAEFLTERYDLPRDSWRRRLCDYWYLQSPWAVAELASLLDYLNTMRRLAGRDWYQVEVPAVRAAPGWWFAAGGGDFELLNSVVAAERCAAAVLGSEMYRRRYGKLPESLAELVPEFLDAVPVDPFTGRELEYRIGDWEIPWRVGATESVRRRHGAAVHAGGDFGETIFALSAPEE